MASVPVWMDAEFRRWTAEARGSVTIALSAAGFDHVDELEELEEHHIALVVAGLPERRADQFRVAIEALKQGAGSGAGADGTVGSGA